ncbi:hypothetical protein QBC39DRAFT_374711 [Podospora conica]|nr:hypothetical protein QBC39DRAFT_374711 [Schizothecium conicum]
MVGVPGKYRGCETCRGRRVKCGNERPYCKRCVDSSRPCTYERETVFIVASIEDGGRCSSHPPRKTTKKGKSKSPSVRPPPEDLQLVAEEPLAPAWNDVVTVSDPRDAGRRRYNLQIAALWTPMGSIVRGGGGGEEDGEEGTAVGFAPYRVPEMRPAMGDEDFEMRARGLVHLSRAGGGGEEGGMQVDGFFLFLFEHNTSLPFSLPPPWKDPNPIRQLGPEAFRVFPNHHFFARVYRPQAIFTALLTRKPTFLSEPPWLTSPFQHHPKTPFDALLDALAPIPALLQRFDHLTASAPTLARRLMAQDLLQNCLAVDALLSGWLADVGATYWLQPSGSGSAPFHETYAFPCVPTALGFLCLWAAQVLFWPVVERLQWIVFEGVVEDGFAPPPQQQMVGGRYGPEAVRAAAGDVCRGLDWVLERTVVPDVVGWAAGVVRGFWWEVGAEGEGMWCEGFRGRLEHKGGEMREVVVGGGRGWWDFGAW